ncbi:MAG: hypothetical protein BWY76_02049 [bacterium ADurb.Bin429]|nr:MAG: hypothetical protein BWY76_02049 [bacterium ADurb.Bin429]
MGRSVKRYCSAAHILPKPLLEQVQQFAAGKTMYVPYAVSRRDFNRMKVLDLRMQGYSLRDIAYRTGLSLRGVCKILQRDRERALAILQLFTTPGREDAGDVTGESERGETPPPRRSQDVTTEELT